MSAPTAADLLQTWEHARTRGPVERALALAAVANPSAPPAELALLSVGRRDALLITLRAQLFGPQLVSVAACPACGEQVSLILDTAQLAATPSGPAELTVALGERMVRARPPSSADLIAVAGIRERGAARQVLLARCLGEDAPLDDAEASMLAQQLALADPLADVQLDLSCPACAQRWMASLDIAAFLWAELDLWARRLLREVHTLAAAYHWSEAAILALSPWRRRQYLELVEP